jgi:hypothetical protein
VIIQNTILHYSPTLNERRHAVVNLHGIDLTHHFLYADVSGSIPGSFFCLFELETTNAKWPMTTTLLKKMQLILVLNHTKSQILAAGPTRARSGRSGLLPPTALRDGGGGAEAPIFTPSGDARRGSTPPCASANPGRTHTCRTRQGWHTV